MDSYQRYLDSKKPKKKSRDFVLNTPLLDTTGAAVVNALLKLKADLKAADAPLLVRLDIHKNS